MGNTITELTCDELSQVTGGLNTWETIGIVAGAVVGTALTIALLYCCVRSQMRLAEQGIQSPVVNSLLPLPGMLTYSSPV